jgi:diguanylate cyclase (GGDEF)-like protein
MWIATVKDIDQIVKQPDKLLTIRESATIAEAARKMSDNHMGCLVVYDTRDKFAGVLTERDMLAKVLTTSLSPETVRVRDIMTTETISCTIETTIAKVEQLMAEYNIRHIPIIEDGIPIGMVSSRDVIAYQLHSSKTMKTAAEQLAMLTTRLKSLDFEDVAGLAVNEVPKSFDADCAVLCFDQKDPSTPMIYRKGCPLSQEKLFDTEKIKQLSENGQVISHKLCNQNEAAGMVIPLTIFEQADDPGESNGNIPGFLCMCRFNPSSSEPEESQLYKASLLGEVLSTNLTNAKLYQNYQKAQRDSKTDPLTGVSVRRVLEKALKAECVRAIRYNRSFCIAIVDLDNLKQINDNAGHAAGDKVLRKVAEIMCSNVRAMDIVARYGGDEFVLLMPETRLSNATALVERLRCQVKTISIPNVPAITVSCGLAEWNSSAQDTAQLILKRADTALYEAKRIGRNRVVCEICA